LSKRKKIILGVALVLLGSFGALWWRTREPSYKGVTLCKWLESETVGYEMVSATLSHKHQAAAAEAAQAIGSKALPALLEKMRATDDTLGNRLKVQANELLDSLSLFGFRFARRPAWVEHIRAIAWFDYLGPRGKEAIPGLAPLLDQPNFNSQINVGLALGCIGPDSLPVLRSGLTNRNWRVRLACLIGLSVMQTNAQVASPDIVARIKDASPSVGFTALRTLRVVLPKQDAQIPVLLEALRNPVVEVRREAVRLLEAVMKIPLEFRVLVGSDNPDPAALEDAVRGLELELRTRELWKRPI
jgi:HEAT repeat protein